MPWPYHPLAQPSNHLIGNGISNLWFKYPQQLILKKYCQKNSLDFLIFLKKLNTNKYRIKGGIKKLIPSYFNQPSQTLGILISGTLLSAFKNRIKPFKLNNYAKKEKVNDCFI